jgi:hypothetical protein
MSKKSFGVSADGFWVQVAPYSADPAGDVIVSKPLGGTRMSITRNSMNMFCGI